MTATTARARRGKKVVEEAVEREEWVMKDGVPILKEEAEALEAAEAEKAEVPEAKAPEAPKVKRARKPKDPNAPKTPRVKIPTEVGGFEVLQEFPKDCVGQRVIEAIKAGAQTYEAVQEFMSTNYDKIGTGKSVLWKDRPITYVKGYVGWLSKNGYVKIL